MNQDTQRILSFWFGAWPYNEQAAQAQSSTWFQASDELDNTIKMQFEPLVEAALNNEFECHCLEDQIACIILLDQFTRNIYRGQGKAFSGDAQSLSICLEIIKKQAHTKLPLLVAVFACMPLQHSEQPHIHDLSIEVFSELVQIHAEKAHSFLEFAHKHKAIIDQFSRYPHRNQALNRASTPAELAYLENDGLRFGQ